jgi:outer membrane protein OmpA-like peptidoglycan-associated protein/DNA-directed RNA polymerase subunit RPC12/RpoP
MVRPTMTVEPIYTCTACSAELAPDRLIKAMPTVCPDCNSAQLGWRDQHSGKWSEQIDTDAEQRTDWIKARFDTNYSGELTSPPETAFAARSYRISMRDSRLSEVQGVSEPPPLVALEGNEPLRFTHLGPVTIAHRDAEVGPERMYSLGLHDVRLHDWDHASIDSEEKDAVELVGRLWGTVYARVKTPVPVVEQTTVPPIVVPTFSDEAPAPIVSHARVDQARVELPSGSAEPHRTEFWRTVRIWWQRYQPAGFFSGRIWLGLAILCLFLMLICRFPAVLGVLVLFALYRFIARIRLPLYLRTLPLGRWRWALPLLGICAALWIFGLITSEIAACQAMPWNAFVVLAVLLSSTAWFRLRIVAALIGALMVLALIFTYQREPMRCGQTLAQAVRTSVTQLPDKITSRVGSRDADTDIIAGESSALRGNRISIEQALSDPHKYFDCEQSKKANAHPYEIYLGESALFGFKQAKLGTVSETHLRKVAQLIESNPDAHIVVTGHSDKTGASLLNLKLSEQRAQSVADWLIQNKVMMSDRIDVRGAGDRNPVVDDPTMYRLNRRVELHLECADAKEKSI